MSLHHIANHLASKGRHGDTTLVHMTKGEVAGLQALAKANGTSLTRNPDTGLPEAFGLKQLLPMAAGAALVASGVGAPLAAGIVGGGTFLATGSLKQGLMAGLGAYGGAGLMGTAGAAGTGVAGTELAAGEAAVAGETAAQKVAEQQLAAQSSITQGAELGAPGVYGSTTPTVGSAAEIQSAIDYNTNAAGNTYELAGTNQSYLGTPAGSTPTGTFRPSFGGEGAYAPGEMPARTIDPMTPSGTGFSQEAQSAIVPKYSTDTFMTKAAAEPWKTVGYGAAALAPAALEEKQYIPPEIKGDSDMGQRYAYDSGYSNDIPGRTGQPEYKAVSNEEAKKLYGFAEGGEVGYPGEPVVRMASGGSAAPSVGYEAGQFSGADYSGYGGVDAGNYSGYGNGNVGNYSGYDTAPNMGIAAVAPAATRAMTSNFTAPSQGLRYDPVSRTFIGSAPGGDTIYKGGGEYGLTEAAQKAADEAAAAEAAAAAPAPESVYYAAQGGLMSYAQGGISTLGGYSDGGRLLKGPGDGMSDNIPAKIGAKQPARLADGEFVVPADVVSHLGNGSTDAGAKQLYKMMDKIRTARTGRKAQGKQVNPNKFLPA